MTAPPPAETGPIVSHPAQLGRLFEDFQVGDIYQHWPGRTVLEADNAWFTLLTMNTHPVHFDTHHSAASEFGKPLVNSLLTLSIVTGMSVRETSQRAIANLGWGEIRLPAPVFVGDTLYARSEVLSARLSKSRPGQGIIEVRTTGFKPAENCPSDSAWRGGPHNVVIEFNRAFLMPCKAAD